MATCVCLLYGQLLPPARVAPFLAAASLAVLAAMGIMLAQFVRRPSAQS